MSRTKRTKESSAAATGSGQRVESSQAGSKERVDRAHDSISFSTIYEENPLMLFVIDTEGIILSVNRSGCSQLGYTREELIGNRVFDIFHGEDREAVAQRFNDALRTPEQPAFWEFRKVRKDGTELWVEEIARPLAGPGGSRAVVVSCEDITERKRTEEHHKRAIQLSDGLNTINTIIHSTLDFDTIMQQAVGEAAKAMGVEAAAIGLFQDESFVVRSVYNFPADMVGRPIPASQLTGIQYTAKVRDVVAFNDTLNDERLNRRMAHLFGIRSMMIAPFNVRGRVLGAIGFCHTTAARHFAEIDIDFGRKLSASLSLALENARLYEDRTQMEEKMRHLAHHDPLTGLSNRRFFQEIVRLELAQARRKHKKMAVLFMDLDRFKEINDTLGHEVGDELLQAVAGRLKASMRESDTISRIGGDEFNILLSDVAHPEHIARITGKVMDCFDEPFQIAGHDLHLTASIGISIFPNDGEKVDSLLRYADIALYYAKEHGRNRYQFYNESINQQSIERMKLEARLRQTLDRGELTVFYQPQISIRTRRIVSAEALVRWNHPEQGLIEPKQFIPAAEDTGFITAIDEFVMRSACAQFRSWQDDGLSPVCFSVNLSAREFQDPHLAEKIGKILKESGAASECLDVEITETLAMSNVERTVSRLKELSEMGVYASIDDFGTGYSSLNYLKRLPIRKLKIDQSFVKDIATDSDDRAIIAAVTAMAHHMRIKVIAEGVETEEQLDFLRHTHCDEAQGFLFSRPLPSRDFSRLLRPGWSRHN